MIEKEREWMNENEIKKRRNKEGINKIENERERENERETELKNKWLRMKARMKE